MSLGLYKHLFDLQRGEDLRDMPMNCDHRMRMKVRGWCRELFRREGLESAYNAKTAEIEFYRTDHDGYPLMFANIEIEATKLNHPYLVPPVERVIERIRLGKRSERTKRLWQSYNQKEERDDRMAHARAHIADRRPDTLSFFKWCERTRGAGRKTLQSAKIQNKLQRAAGA